MGFLSLELKNDYHGKLKKKFDFSIDAREKSSENLVGRVNEIIKHNPRETN